MEMEREQECKNVILTEPKNEPSVNRNGGKKVTGEEIDDEDERVEIMTRAQIKKNYKRRYPEIEDEVYQSLIKPNKQTHPSRHIEISFELMNEREKYQRPEIKECLLELAI